MASDPRVLALLEEMLEWGRTPEEVCRDCPELLAEVRRRWQAFRLVDGSLAALFPDPETPLDTEATQPVPQPAALPQVPGYRVQALLGHGGIGVVYKAWHLRLQRTVALKMLLAGIHARPQEVSGSVLGDIGQRNRSGIEVYTLPAVHLERQDASRSSH